MNDSFEILTTSARADVDRRLGEVVARLRREGFSDEAIFDLFAEKICGKPTLAEEVPNG